MGYLKVANITPITVILHDFTGCFRICLLRSKCL